LASHSFNEVCSSLDTFSVSKNSASAEELNREVANNDKECTPVEVYSLCTLPSQASWSQIVANRASYVLEAQVARTKVMVLQPLVNHDFKETQVFAVEHNQSLSVVLTKLSLEHLKNDNVDLRMAGFRSEAF